MVAGLAVLLYRLTCAVIGGLETSATIPQAIQNHGLPAAVKAIHSIPNVVSKLQKEGALSAFQAERLTLAISR